MSIESGTRLGPYEILEPIGKGGMGEVYKAKDTRLERTVAIKVLPEHLAESPERKARFEREAKAISQLNHPNICTLHDVGEQDGVDYLVMEYIEGETLAERLAKGALKLEQALSYGIQIADALDRAHRAGIVHRDLKPANVMLTKSGVKLLDFGLARLVEADDDSDTSDAPTRQKDLTAEQAIVGTLQYMAPEQLERKPADARTDAFALGLVLYEMITGRKAFEGASQASLMSSIMRDLPRPMSELVPIAPIQLERTVVQCLEKDPDERWQSLADVGRQLRWLVEDLEAKLETDERATSKGVHWPVVALIAAAAALASWFLKTSPPEQELPLRTFTREIAPYASTVAALVESSAISPDGTMLAYNDASAGSTALWVRDLSSVTPRELPASEGAMAPFWSPDNRHLGFFTDGTPATLNRVAVDGGAATVLCDLPDRRPRGAVWLANGTIIFGVRGDDEQTAGTLYSISEQGGAPTVFAEADLELDQRGLMFPSVLPDGETLLFAASVGDDGGALIALRDGGREIIYTDPLERLAYPIFSSSGHIVFQRGFTASKGVWGVAFDPGRLQTSSEPFLIDAEGGHPTIADDGTLVYGSSAQLADLPGQLVWVDRQGSIERIDEVRPGLGTPALSPDGRLVAFDALQNDNRDIFVLDIERNQLARLTFDRSRDRYPVWSRDGRLLAFQSYRSGGGDIYAVPADGSADEVLLVDGRRNDTPNTWTVDGKHLIYTYFADDTAQDLMLAPVASEGGVQPDGPTRPLLQTRRNEGWGDVSPDGRFIVYDSNESGQFEIYVTPFPEADRRWQISSDGGSWPRWGPSGDNIYYMGGGVATGYGPMMRVRVRTSEGFESDVAERLFEGPQGVNFTWFSIAPGEERFLAIEKQFGQSPKVTLTLVQNWARAYED